MHLLWKGAVVNEHDPLCPVRQCERVCGSYPDCTHFCVCSLIAKVRADEWKKTAVITRCLINKLGGTIEISEKELMTSNGIITSTRDLSRQSLILEVIDE